MKKVIEIDTNGDNHHKYRDNLELFDIIAPMVKGFITEGYELCDELAVKYNVSSWKPKK